ncbi:chloride channel protein [Bdellovibrionota bacterium]
MERLRSLPSQQREAIGAIVGGVLVGVVAVLFAILGEYAAEGMHWVISFSPWYLLVLTPSTFLLAIFLLKKFFPSATGSGIPQTIAALRSQPGQARKYVSLKASLGKILTTVIALFGGASLGREGPTVQVGAGIMREIGVQLHLGPTAIRHLILAGGGAGIAAAFNAPLAGLVFAIEELSLRSNRVMTNFILLGVLVAGVVSQIILGDHPFFTASILESVYIVEIQAAVIVGGIAGIVGGLFSKFLLTGTRKLARFAKTHPFILAGTFGIIIALIGIFTQGGVLGTGYLRATDWLQRHEHMNPLIYSGLKFLTTLLSYMSGLAGGIFAPSLAIGSSIGASLAFVLPKYVWANCAFLGMAAYFSAVVQAPLTAFVIVFEMTAAHKLMLPLMLASFIGYLISRRICKQSLYRGLLQIPEEEGKK